MEEGRNLKGRELLMRVAAMLTKMVSRPVVPAPVSEPAPDFSVAGM